MTTTPNVLTLRRPDDWHCHFRSGPALARTVSDHSQQFARAIAMPNLKPPITNAQQALQYYADIKRHIPVDQNFEPLMTLYLTDQTTAAIITEAAQEQHVVAAKLYPAHATTNAQAGVTALKNIYPALKALTEYQLPLLIHAEMGDPAIDIFEREQIFIAKFLPQLINDFPDLKIVIEHVSTRFAVDFVLNAPNNVAATITPHHLLFNRNQLLAGGLKADYYCLPILKTVDDQAALVAAATSGNPKFFLGTDSAPHTTLNKYCACASAGIYNAHGAFAIYAMIFEQAQAIDRLENFASRFGAEFYGLPLNQQTITLVKQNWQMPNKLSFGSDEITPMLAGQTISWQISE